MVSELNSEKPAQISQSELQTRDSGAFNDSEY